MGDDDLDLDNFLGRWTEGGAADEQDFLQVAIGIILLGQVIEKEFQNMAKATLGLGAGDLRILLTLRRAPPHYELRPTDLFRRLLVSSGAVTKQVDRLEKNGFVERIYNAAKKRGWLIRLTKKGEIAADKILNSSGPQLGAAWAAYRNLSLKDQDTGLDFIRSMLEELMHDRHLDKPT